MRCWGFWRAWLPADSWQRVLAGDGEERREFLRAIDTVKKRTQRARKWSGDVEQVADRHGQHARYLSEERELVRQAAERLRPWVHVTPVLESRTLDARCGGSVLLKCENFQRVGALRHGHVVHAGVSSLSV